METKDDIVEESGSVESDEENDEQLYRLKRKSFYTKSYNPEMEIDESEFKVYPKSKQAKMKLKSTLENNLLFKSLEPEQLSALIDAMIEIVVQPNQTILRRGKDNDRFFVVDSGKYEITREFRNGKEIITNGTFGELTLIHNQPSESTVISTTEGKLFALNRNDYRKIVTKTTYEIRKSLENVIDNVPLLRDLPSKDKLKIADVVQLLNYEDGESIMKDNYDGLYLVLRGCVQIVENDESQKRVVESGQYFGEVSTVNPVQKRRRLTASARGFTKIALLKTQAFERLAGPCLKVLKKNQDSRKAVANSEKVEKEEKDSVEG